MWYIGRAWGRARLKSRLGPLRRMHGNAHATHLDSKMVPSGRRAGRAPDHGRFASSPRAVVAVVVVVISCRASTGQSIGSRMTWDGSSRTPGAREEGRRRARRKHERHAGLLAVGGRRVLRRRQHRRGAHRARRERAERQGVRRRLGSPESASRPSGETWAEHWGREPGAQRLARSARPSRAACGTSAPQAKKILHTCTSLLYRASCPLGSSPRRNVHPVRAPVRGGNSRGRGNIASF